jgi:hypothetical protein
MLLVLLFMGLPAGVSAQDAASASQTPGAKAEEKPSGKKAQEKPRGKERKISRTFPTPEKLPAKYPEETSDPMEVLRRAAQTSSELTRVYYEARFKGIDPNPADVPYLWGTVVLGGRSDTSTEKFRVMVPGKVPGPSGFVTAMAGSDGKVFFLVDVKKETVTESEDRAVISDMAQMLEYLAVRQITHTEPFSKEMKADKVEFKGSDKVNGIPCYVVHVSNADGSEQTHWYFSIRDGLPRRIERIKVDSTGKTGTAQLTLEKMAINPHMVRDPFTTYVPKGYKVVSSLPDKKADQKTEPKAKQETERKTRQP